MLAKKPHDLLGPQNRVATHRSDSHKLCSNELGLEPRLSVLKKQFDNFTKIRLKLIQRVRLGMRARPTWHVSHKHARLGATLDDGGEWSHA